MHKFIKFANYKFAKRILRLMKIKNEKIKFVFYQLKFKLF